MFYNDIQQKIGDDFSIKVMFENIQLKFTVTNNEYTYLYVMHE